MMSAMGEIQRPRSADGGEALDLSALSPREREVLEAAVEGLSARAIAQRLSVSEPTVRSHLASIYAKVGVSGRVELLARLRHGAASEGPAPPAMAGTAHREPRPRWWRRRRTWLAAGTSLALLLVGFLLLRPDLPPRSDLPTVSGLLAAGGVRSLDLHGQSLTVVETTGQSLRVEGVSGLDFNTLLDLAKQRSVGVTITGDSGPGVLVTLLYALLPVLVFPLAGVIVLLLVIRLLRHPPAYPPAA